MVQPQRKRQRLIGYDYSQNNAYFITICTQDRIPLLGKMESDAVCLSKTGKMVEEELFAATTICGMEIDKHVIMPNHIHAIVMVNHTGTTQRSFPTLSEMVRRFKTRTTYRYIHAVNNGEAIPFDKKIWQKSFYDHIIRNEKGYLEVWQYIDDNPLKWRLDELL